MRKKISKKAQAQLEQAVRNGTNAELKTVMNYLLFQAEEYRKTAQVHSRQAQRFWAAGDAMEGAARWVKERIK